MPVITSMVACHVLNFYGEDFPQGGSFTVSLLTTFAKADPQNFGRLADAFPDYGAAMSIAKTVPDGMNILKSITTGSLNFDTSRHVATD